VADGDAQAVGEKDCTRGREYPLCASPNTLVRRKLLSDVLRINTRYVPAISANSFFFVAGMYHDNASSLCSIHDLRPASV